MIKSYLEKKCFIKRTYQSLRAYNKKINYWSRLYKKERKRFFNGLNSSFVTDSKLFWRTVKSLFCDKENYRANIKLVKEGKLWSFEPESSSDIELGIRLLNLKKATAHKNIAPKTRKSSFEATVNALHRLFVEAIIKSVFPDNFKLSEVTTVFTKDDPFDKKTTVSVLPAISKIYERLMQRQTNNYITNHLSPYLCVYEKVTTPNRLWFLSQKN